MATHCATCISTGQCAKQERRSDAEAKLAAMLIRIGTGRLELPARDREFIRTQVQVISPSTRNVRYKQMKAFFL